MLLLLLLLLFCYVYFQLVVVVVSDFFIVRQNVCFATIFLYSRFLPVVFFFSFLSFFFCCLVSAARHCESRKPRWWWATKQRSGGNIVFYGGNILSSCEWMNHIVLPGWLFFSSEFGVMRLRLHWLRVHNKCKRLLILIPLSSNDRCCIQTDKLIRLSTDLSHLSIST